MVLRQVRLVWPTVEPKPEGGYSSSIPLGMTAKKAKVTTWILDTGASNHMLPPGKAGNQTYKAERPLRIRTAAGVVDCDRRAYVDLPALKDAVEAIILPDTPCALSVGRLIDAGYLFYWEDQVPRLITPTGEEAEIFVMAHVPYILHDPTVDGCIGEETEMDSEFEYAETLPKHILKRKVRRHRETRSKANPRPWHGDSETSSGEAARRNTR